VRDLELRLAEAVQARNDAEAAARVLRPAAPGAPAEAGAPVDKLTRERDSYAQQLSDRDARISRLQRELADKSERLGRLAKELSELKSRGLGKLFQR
jgi:chromosome segregation ATPase